MTTTPQSLQPGVTLTSTNSTIFTATGTTIVTASTFANPTTSTSTLTVTLTRSNNSSVIVIPGQSLLSQATYQAPELSGIVLNNGDILSAKGTGITSVITGYTIS